MGEAAAFTATDYKALVCVFLYGGNDYANTVVTYDDDSYNRYAAIRGGAARQAAALRGQGGPGQHRAHPTVPPPGGRQYALHPATYRAWPSCSTQARRPYSSTGGRWWCRSRVRNTAATTVRCTPAAQAVLAQRPAIGVAVVIARRLHRGLGRQPGRPGFVVQRQLAVHLHLGHRQRGVPLGRLGLSYQVSTGGAIAINGVKNNVYSSSAVRGAHRTHPADQPAGAGERIQPRHHPRHHGQNRKSPPAWRA